MDTCTVSNEEPKDESSGNKVQSMSKAHDENDDKDANEEDNNGLVEVNDGDDEMDTCTVLKEEPKDESSGNKVQSMSKAHDENNDKDANEEDDNGLVEVNDSDDENLIFDGTEVGTLEESNGEVMTKAVFREKALQILHDEGGRCKINRFRNIFKKKFNVLPSDIENSNSWLLCFPEDICFRDTDRYLSVVKRIQPIVIGEKDSIAQKNFSLFKNVLKEYLQHSYLNRVVLLELWSELDKHYKVDGMESLKQLAGFETYDTLLWNINDVVLQSGIYIQLKFVENKYTINNINDLKKAITERLKTSKNNEMGVPLLWTIIKHGVNRSSDLSFLKGKSPHEAFEECNDIIEFTREKKNFVKLIDHGKKTQETLEKKEVTSKRRTLKEMIKYILSTSKKIERSEFLSKLGSPGFIHTLQNCNFSGNIQVFEYFSDILLVDEKWVTLKEIPKEEQLLSRATIVYQSLPKKKTNSKNFQRKYWKFFHISVPNAFCKDLINQFCSTGLTETPNTSSQLNSPEQSQMDHGSQSSSYKIKDTKSGSNVKSVSSTSTISGPTTSAQDHNDSFENQVHSILKENDGECNFDLFMTAFCQKYNKLPPHPSHWEANNQIPTGVIILESSIYLIREDMDSFENRNNCDNFNDSHNKYDGHHWDDYDDSGNNDDDDGDDNDDDDEEDNYDDNNSDDEVDNYDDIDCDDKPDYYDAEYSDEHNGGIMTKEIFRKRAMRILHDAGGSCRINPFRNMFEKMYNIRPEHINNKKSWLRCFPNDICWRSGDSRLSLVKTIQPCVTDLEGPDAQNDLHQKNLSKFKEVLIEYLTHSYCNRTYITNLWSELESHYKVDGNITLKQMAGFNNIPKSRHSHRMDMFLKKISDVAVVEEKKYIKLKLNPKQIEENLNDLKRRIIAILKRKKSHKMKAVPLWKQLKRESLNKLCHYGGFYGGTNWQSVFKKCKDVMTLSKNQNFVQLTHPGCDNFIKLHDSIHGKGKKPIKRNLPKQAPEEAAMPTSQSNAKDEDAGSRIQEDVRKKAKKAKYSEDMRGAPSDETLKEEAQIANEWAFFL